MHFVVSYFPSNNLNNETSVARHVEAYNSAEAAQSYVKQRLSDEALYDNPLSNTLERDGYVFVLVGERAAGPKMGSTAVTSQFQRLIKVEQTKPVAPAFKAVGIKSL